MKGLPDGYAPPEEVLRLAAGFDYADHFAATSGKELRLFLAEFFSFSPVWLRGLYALRRPLAGILGIESSLQSARRFRAEDIPFAQGGSMWIFKVGAAREGEYWAATAEDTHLRAVLAVTREPVGGGLSRYRVMTFVTFKNWRGPVYFRLIKPFHGLVIKAMMRAAV